MLPDHLSWNDIPAIAFVLLIDGMAAVILWQVFKSVADAIRTLWRKR